MSLKITITSNAQKAMVRLNQFPGVLMETIRDAMDVQNELAAGYVVKNRLSGTGPYPPSQHKLGVVEGRLWKSINVSTGRDGTGKAQIQGNKVVSSIGSNVEYAGLHEFGFSGAIGVKSHSRGSHKRARWTTTKKGDPRKRKSGVSASVVRAHTRNVNIPARAPIKHGLDDYAPTYGAGFSRSIVRAFRSLAP